jgi:peptide/nickel transport system substrate-binding protein
VVGGKYVAALAALALVASGCGLGRPADAVTVQYLTVGTTDKVSSLDPAGSYDNGSLQVMNQVYLFLMNFVPGSGDLKPDIAERCDFTAPTSYTCKLKPNLKFANGHALTSSDVKFSIDRETKIKS